jgi:hypothetical protein
MFFNKEDLTKKNCGYKCIQQSINMGSVKLIILVWNIHKLNVVIVAQWKGLSLKGQGPTNTSEYMYLFEYMYLLEYIYTLTRQED